jgi:4-hydroxybenzoate polyprenyltransferase
MISHHYCGCIGLWSIDRFERERSQQRENQRSFAGLRSFAICAILGAVCFLFGPYFGIAGALITGGIVIYSLKNQTDDPGVTTEIAFILTYFIGGMCFGIFLLPQVYRSSSPSC